MKKILLISLFITHLATAQKSKKELDRFLQPAIFSLTMVMIHDVANPPAASRFYTYCLLGAQEIVAQNNKEIVSPSAYTKAFGKIEIETRTGYDYKIAALYCILETGRIILPSGYMLEDLVTVSPRGAKRFNLFIILISAGFPPWSSAPPE